MVRQAGLTRLRTRGNAARALPVKQADWKMARHRIATRCTEHCLRGRVASWCALVAHALVGSGSRSAGGPRSSPVALAGSNLRALRGALIIFQKGLHGTRRRRIINSVLYSLSAWLFHCQDNGHSAIVMLPTVLSHGSYRLLLPIAAPRLLLWVSALKILTKRSAFDGVGTRSTYAAPKWFR